MHRLLPLIALAACSQAAAPAPVEPDVPRLVSLSPALTEMLFDLDLGDRVVGVASYSVLPAGEERPVVGDALTVSTEAVLAVEPDALLVQVEADRFAALQALAPDLRVEHFRIETLDEVAAALRRVADLGGAPERGGVAARAFEAELHEVRAAAAPGGPRVLFVLGWEKPATAGRGTFLHEMIEAAGAVNAAAHFEGWRSLDLEAVLTMQPEVLVCWTSEAEAEEARARWTSLQDLPAARSGRVHVVTDPHWTLPTARLGAFTRDLARMVRGPDAVGQR